MSSIHGTTPQVSSMNLRISVSSVEQFSPRPVASSPHLRHIDERIIESFRPSTIESCEPSQGFGRKEQGKLRIRVTRKVNVKTSARYVASMG